MSKRQIEEPEGAGSSDYKRRATSLPPELALPQYVCVVVTRRDYAEERDGNDDVYVKNVFSSQKLANDAAWKLSLGPIREDDEEEEDEEEEDDEEKEPYDGVDIRDLGIERVGRDDGFEIPWPLDVTKPRLRFKNRMAIGELVKYWSDEGEVRYAIRVDVWTDWTVVHKKRLDAPVWHWN